jgi:hypothetical protein
MITLLSIVGASFAKAHGVKEKTADLFIVVGLFLDIVLEVCLLVYFAVR